MKKAIAIFMAILMLAGICSVAGAAADPVTYSFDEATGVLTFSGTGEMKNYYGIYKSPFAGNARIRSVVIENGVTTIGSYAFYNCYGLSSITIPPSVTSIGSDAFSYCNRLTDITIPGSLKSIGDRVFTSCKGLKSVTISDGVESIGSSAFSNCSSLTEVSIPDTVTSIGQNAFSYCLSLTEVTIPGGVTSIKGSLFMDCSGLKNVTIGSGVKTIDAHAFVGCTSLTELTIPNNVTSIGEYVFAGCTGLTELTIPDSVKYIEEGAFNQVANVIYNGTASGAPWGARAMNGYAEYPFVYADTNKTDLRACQSGYQGEITIPGNVTSIGAYAFKNCAGLTAVTIPDSVKTIGEGAFSNCAGLTSVKLPNRLQTIESYLFYYCSNLKSVTIPNSVKTIRYQAFYYCTALTDAAIPNGVTRIGEESFGEAKNIEYHGSASGAPWGSRSINGYVEFPLVYADAGKTALLACSSGFSGEITVPESVQTIGNFAFFNCTGLTNLTIGSSVTTIGYTAFDACTSLTSMTIPDSVTSLGGNVFGSCTNLKSVKLSENITEIGFSTFYGCASLESITIPDCVETIGNVAFQNCVSLTSVTIGRGVTSIEDRAFMGCMNLTDVYYSGDQTDWNGISFGYFNNELRNAAIHYSTGGLCGANAVYRFDAPKSLLTISGSGAMDDYSYFYPFDHSPFYKNTEIQSAEIQSDITRVGDAAFYGCDCLTNVSFSDSVTSVGNSAFANTGLSSVYIPASVESIGQYAFGYQVSDGENGADFSAVKVEGFTISGSEGSAAEQYAIDNGFTFIDVDEKLDEQKVYAQENLETAPVGGYAEFDVTVGGSPAKIQFVNSKGSTITYTRDHANVTGITANANGSETWHVKLKVARASETYTIRLRYGRTWTDADAAFTLTAKQPETGVVSAAVAASAVVGDPGAINVTAYGSPTKVQFTNSRGGTFTYTRDHASVSGIKSNDNGTETWMINLKVYRQKETYVARAKYAYTGWASSAAVFTLAAK